MGKERHGRLSGIRRLGFNNGYSSFHRCVALVLAIVHFCLNLGPFREEIHKYELKKNLGKGGFGEVWHARHRKTGEDVAIKFLTVSGREGFNDAIKESLRMETCRHDNVVKLKDMFVYFKGVALRRTFSSESPWNLCMVLEYCNGGDLGDKIKIWAEGPRHEWPEPDTALGIYIKAIASGLKHMHNRTIAHLDLKPGNILLSDDLLEVKLCDLGLAVEAHAHSPIQGTQRGTYGYMAPELWQNELYGTKADIWALGCLLVDIMLPNHEGGWSLVEEIKKHRKDNNFPVIEKMTSDIWFGYGDNTEGTYNEARKIILENTRIKRDRKVRDIVENCLEANPDRRWPAAKVLGLIDPNASPPNAFLMNVV